MKQRQSCIVSPCKKYVVTITKTDKHILEVQNVSDRSMVNTFNIQDIVSDYFETPTRNISIEITQLEWEHILPTSKTKLLAIVVDNYSLVLIIDITQPNVDPIVIRQTKHDGIEKCQWIPPPLDIEQQNEGAYTNSRQIIVFTKHNLSLKVYSLDCTHILFTIEKPVIDNIVIRPNKHHRFWSILGNTREYNSAPVLYHFYNQGPISVLVHKIRLPHPFTTSPQITWSDSGNWVSIFNDEETLFGYHLMIYSFLGIVESKRIRPILDVDCFTEGFDSDISPCELNPIKFIQNWWITDKSEYLLISRIIDSNVKIQIVSMKLLRVVNDITLEIPQVIQGWKQDKNRIHFSKFTLPTIQIINSIITQDSNLFVILNNSLILYYEITHIEEEFKFKFEFKAIISTFERIIDFTITEKEVVISTESQVLSYNIIKNVLESLFKSFTKISRISYVNEELLVFYDQLAHWVIIKGENNEALVLKKRNLLNTSVIDDYTITDTFNLRKRLKR